MNDNELRLENEGLELVAWEVYYQDDGSFNAITRSKDTVEEYSKMAYDIYPLCRHSEALALVAGLRERIAALESGQSADMFLALTGEITRLRAELATPAHIPDAVEGVAFQAAADEAFRGWEKDGNPISGVNGYMAARAGFREGAAWQARIVSALQASAMAVPKCKCSMSISVLGDGCRHCQPQEYIDRLHDQMEDDLAMVVPDGWIAVSDRLPEVPEGEEQEVIVCVKRAHNGESYVFSARYLNAFLLYNDDIDGESTTATGWNDVKEHSEYDGWYSRLIDDGSGDEVTHWMPLAASPTPGESK
jgi:hypothetical protein